ncbi:MAG: hypothetical protein ACT4PM_05290 [Gemmatimonadales bacterium]
MVWVVPLLVALAAFFSYRFLEEWSRRTWLPALLRAAGWGMLVLLLVNASCPGVRPDARPIVLLDGSLSMQAAGSRWTEAQTLARRRGEVRLVGVPARDTLPTGGRSRLAPAITAAQSTGRPVVVITDGEVDDAAEVLADPLAGPEIRVLARRTVEDLSLTRVQGTTRLTPRDSLRLEVDLAGSPGFAGRRVGLEVREGARVWVRGSTPLDSAARATVRLVGAVPSVAPGAHVLSVAITGASDAEPRNDIRLWVVHLVPTPGVVVTASPPSWESRFLIATLSEVAELPVRGYLEFEPGKWRRAGDLVAASRQEVGDAARRADLLVTMGSAQDPIRVTGPRGRWTWLASPSAASGDWYVQAGTAGPVPGSLAGLPVDSFPPGTALTDPAPRPEDWVGLSAQLGRRGPVRPAVIGRDSAGVRVMVTAIDGLWRWAFRGGSSEQGYRALVASAVSWLLGGATAEGGQIRLRHDVVPRGLPALFEWRGGGNPVPLALEWVGDSGTRRDTLVFDGTGRAEVWLPPGSWRYRVDGRREGGILAVEAYSDEWSPRRVTLVDRTGPVIGSRSRRPVRAWLWLFALAGLCFAGEWAVRRSMGLR